MLTGLLLGSGGVKGYLLIGGLSFLAKNGYLKKIKHICGVSVGSIIALLYMTGYSPADMINLSLNLDVPSINLSQILTIATKLLSQGYLYDLEPLMTQIDKYLQEHNFTRPTFEDIYNYTGIKFSVVAYDLTLHKKVYFSHQTHPKMKCLDAIRLSCALPVLFDEQKYDQHCYIDGAFVSPCPLDVFDENDEVIALITQIDLNRSKMGLNVLDKIMDISELLFQEKIEHHIENAKCKHQVIRFQTDTFNPLAGPLSANDRKTLFITGYEHICLNI